MSRRPDPAFCGDHVLVHAFQGGGAGGEVVLGGAAPGGVLEGGQAGGVQELQQALGERLGRGGAHGAVHAFLDQVQRGGALRGHQGGAGGEGLDHAHGQDLAGAGGEKDVGGGEQFGHAGVGHRAGEGHAFGRAGLGLRVGAAGAVPDDQQPQFRAGGARLTEGAEHHAQVLLRGEAAQVRDEGHVGGNVVLPAHRGPAGGLEAPQVHGVGHQVHGARVPVGAQHVHHGAARGEHAVHAAGEGRDMRADHGAADAAGHRRVVQVLLVLRVGGVHDGRAGHPRPLQRKLPGEKGVHGVQHVQVPQREPRREAGAGGEHHGVVGRAAQRAGAHEGRVQAVHALLAGGQLRVAGRKDADLVPALPQTPGKQGGAGRHPVPGRQVGGGHDPDAHSAGSLPLARGGAGPGGKLGA